MMLQYSMPWMLLIVYLTTTVVTTHSTTRIPIIIDTDIGTDIDDTFAVAEALSSPELDIKLILTATHNAIGRAQILCKYLEAVGRTDIAVGIGWQQDSWAGYPLYAWAQDYNLSSYPGILYKDGISEAINIIKTSLVPITIVEIAPATNIEIMLALEPSIVENTIIKAMSGNFKACVQNGSSCPEPNVQQNITASQAMYSASWLAMSTTPQDTSTWDVLNGELYQTLRMGNNSYHPVLEVAFECLVFWADHGGWDANYTTTTSIMCDPVAIYMAFSDCSYCNMTPLNIIVDDEGRTIVSPEGKLINVCLTWTGNGEGATQFQELLVARLLSNSLPPQ